MLPSRSGKPKSAAGIQDGFRELVFLSIAAAKAPPRAQRAAGGLGELLHHLREAKHAGPGRRFLVLADFETGLVGYLGRGDKRQTRIGVVTRGKRLREGQVAIHGAGHVDGREMDAAAKFLPRPLLAPDALAAVIDGIVNHVARTGLHSAPTLPGKTEGDLLALRQALSSVSILSQQNSSWLVSIWPQVTYMNSPLKQFPVRSFEDTKRFVVGRVGVRLEHHVMPRKPFLRARCRSERRRIGGERGGQDSQG